MRVQASLPAIADTELASLPPVEKGIVDVPMLRNDLPVALRPLRSKIKPLVVVVSYGFGNRQLLSRLDNANVIALAAPADPAQIARSCHLGMSVDPAPTSAFWQMLKQSAPPRRHDDAFLQQLNHMPSGVLCECPNHLADLLSKLNAFESYSFGCESTNTKNAALHAMMCGASSHCRELVEDVLRQVLAHGGIPEPKK